MVSRFKINKLKKFTHELFLLLGSVSIYLLIYAFINFYFKICSIELSTLNFKIVLTSLIKNVNFYIVILSLLGLSYYIINLLTLYKQNTNTFTIYTINKNSKIYNNSEILNIISMIMTIFFSFFSTSLKTNFSYGIFLLLCVLVFMVKETLLYNNPLLSLMGYTVVEIDMFYFDSSNLIKRKCIKKRSLNLSKDEEIKVAISNYFFLIVDRF